MAADPVVVLVGTLDTKGHELEYMRDRVREAGADVHNPTVTLVRTTAEENAELGRRIAEKLNRAPTVLFVPLGGVSAIDVDGQPSHDPQADAALFDALREHLDRDRVEVREIDAQVNDPAFATAMAEWLHELIHEAR
ncbi:MAG TPA: Tm-1-like ATP-binding domain-containing protein [Thermoleophilaceae bacterium]|nr:Tm-1-like ATP-binding domain-containing protein [Thermoleophilaceae bacterium]